MLALQAGHVSVVALVAVLAGAGCAGSPARGPTSNQVPPSTVAGAPSVPTSDPATECAPPTQLSWTDVSLPDGTQFGWVRHFDGHALYLDPAEFFSDDEASAAAREDGEFGETEDLPNPFYIRDPDADVVRIEVAGAFTLTVIDGALYPAERTLRRGALALMYCPNADTPWMYSPPDRLPAQLEIFGGIAGSATEQYLP